MWELEYLNCVDTARLQQAAMSDGTFCLCTQFYNLRKMGAFVCRTS